MGDSLLRKRCVPCEGGEPALTKSQASKLKPQIGKEWEFTDPEDKSGRGAKIRRKFKFKDFKQAMGFVNRVADLAEVEGHHPDISISWSRVTLTLWTHAVGGLSENDFIMAVKIDKFVKTS